jgi:hypothetical protein
MSDGVDTPPQFAGFLRVKVEEIDEAILAFYMTKNITDVRALRKQSVHRFDEFIFVYEGVCLSFCSGRFPDSPEPNVGSIVAGETVLVVRAVQMDEVTALARL